MVVAARHHSTPEPNSQVFCIYSFAPFYLRSMNTARGSSDAKPSIDAAHSDFMGVECKDCGEASGQTFLNKTTVLNCALRVASCLFARAAAQ
jgi:ribosomal protein S27E